MNFWLPGLRIRRPGHILGAVRQPGERRITRRGLLRGHPHRGCRRGRRVHSRACALDIGLRGRRPRRAPRPPPLRRRRHHVFMHGRGLGSRCPTPSSVDRVTPATSASQVRPQARRARALGGRHRPGVHAAGPRRHRHRRRRAQPHGARRPLRPAAGHRLPLLHRPRRERRADVAHRPDADGTGRRGGRRSSRWRCVPAPTSRRATSPPTRTSRAGGGGEIGIVVHMGGFTSEYASSIRQEVQGGPPARTTGRSAPSPTTLQCSHYRRDVELQDAHAAAPGWSPGTTTGWPTTSGPAPGATAFHGDWATWNAAMQASVAPVAAPPPRAAGTLHAALRHPRRAACSTATAARRA